MATKDAWTCSICHEARKDVACVIPCEHTFCLLCILRWTMRKFTCPLCRRLMYAIRSSLRADGSLTSTITLPSEYEEESHTASLQGHVTSGPTPSGTPAGPNEEEQPGTSHSAPRHVGNHSTTPDPREMNKPPGEPEQTAAGSTTPEATAGPATPEATAGPATPEATAGPATPEATAGPTTEGCSRDCSPTRPQHRRKRRAHSAQDPAQPPKRPPPRHQ